MNPRLRITTLMTAILLMVVSFEGKAQSPSDLFISEYIEGSSNNKALEFYNGTGAAINLTAGNYVVQYYFNGSTTAGLSISLTGTVANNSTYILAQSTAVFLTANGGTVVADLTNSGSWYNGNDAVVLRKGGASGTVIDVIGQVGFDPGTEWGTGLTSTQDNTLRRKASACSGDTNPSDAFNPATSYDGFATNTFDGLGIHTSSCVSGPSINVSVPSLSFTTPVGTNLQQSYTVQGNLLTNDITITVPAATEFTVSLSSGGPFSNSVTVPFATANAGPVTVFVKFAPTSNALQSGNLTHTSGAVSTNLPLQGTTSSTITPIYTIQGSGSASTFDGSVVTTEGIVTADFQGANQLGGFFIQDTTGDGNTATSDGVFVFNTTFSVNVGDYVRLTAEVDEFNTLTELKNLTSLSILSSGNPLKPAVSITLPVSSVSDLERYEGMRVQFLQTLTATEVFTLGRFGEVLLSANGRLFNPTNFVDLNDNPASGTNSTGNSNGAAVTAQQDLNNRSKILLDDDGNVENPPMVPYLNPADTTLRVGSTVTNLTGIMDFGFSEYRIRPTQAPSFNYAARPAVPSVGAAANVKVASFNVLNYFNGDGSGGGFPTSRGADSPAEFARQRTKIINAIKELNADVIGLIEIENDGSGAASAIADLVNGLNAATAPGTYALIADPTGGNGNTGTDEIKQAIIYKPAAVTPVGLARADMNVVHNRPPVAQTFTLNSNAEKFTVIVNHFKSKSCTGASGTNADQGDGQSCFNASRKQQAAALLTFISTIQSSTGDPDVISIGDFNSYEEEDPIDILRAGGLTPAAAGVYSYVFDGQTGALDYAFVTPSLVSKITGANKWHINSDEPIFKDYNQEFNQPYAYSPGAYRSSDHDPVLVGLHLGALANVPPVVNITSPANNASFPAGSDITVNVAANDADGSVTKVEFYYIAGTTSVLLATDSTAPYSVTGNDITGGVYPVYVKAYDNSGAVTVSDTVNIIVTACTGSGSITAEGFANIPGATVADLTNNPAYPNNPAITAQLGSFETPDNLADQYGLRLRGYICAPLTGQYTFYIASDEQSELWLSTDDNPANKVKIAFLNSPVGPRAWTVFPSQKSAPVTLVAGARYYVEVLHKENFGNDNLAVGWVRPDGAGEGPIPGNYLSPWSTPGGLITVANAGTETAAAMTEALQGAGKLTVIATPNPALAYFTLVTRSGSDEKLTVVLRDIMGRELERRINQPANGTIKMGATLTAGIYFAEVFQGSKKQTLKLVKK